MKTSLNSGNNIESAEEMENAIPSSGGVPSVNVTVSGPPEAFTFSTLRLEGVITISNIEYSEEGLSVWKAYKIGPGKFTVVQYTQTVTGRQSGLRSVTDHDGSSPDHDGSSVRERLKYSWRCHGVGFCCVMEWGENVGGSSRSGRIMTDRDDPSRR